MSSWRTDERTGTHDRGHDPAFIAHRVSLIVTLLMVLIVCVSCQQVAYPNVRQAISEDDLPAKLQNLTSDRERYEWVAEWVFSTFPKSAPNGEMRDYGELNYDIEQMLADVEAGGSFQCNDRATILARAMVVLGYQARQVPLRNDDGEGHMVAEAYLPDEKLWMVYDPMAEQYYIVNGKPASALTLLHIARSARSSQVEVSCGPPFRDMAEFYMQPRLAVMDSSAAPNFTPTHPVRIETEDERILLFRDGKWFEWPNSP